MSEKNDEAAKKAAAEKAEKDKADKEAAKLLAKENADLKKKLAKAEGKNVKATEKIGELTQAAKDKAEADADAKAEADAADDGKPKDQASQVTEPVPQPDDPEPNADRVVVGKLVDGKRFYGEDFGEGKLVDRYTGKEVVMSSVEKTIKVVDPQNPKVMRPKKIIVPVYKLK